MYYRVSVLNSYLNKCNVLVYCSTPAPQHESLDSVFVVMKLSVEYNAINERNTFSNGDVLAGQVIVKVSKETTIKSLTIKAKAKASVAFTETYGKVRVTYWDKERYFSQTDSIQLDQSKNVTHNSSSVLANGTCSPSVFCADDDVNRPMKLSVEYNAINERNTFSNGDVLAGQVIVKVSKETTIKSLTIKAKAKASVAFTETYGKVRVTYWDKERYFSQTDSIQLDESKNVTDNSCTSSVLANGTCSPSVFCADDDVNRRSTPAPQHESLDSVFVAMKLSVEYNAINERNTFSNGDVLAGQVIVEVSKETTIKSLTIKAKAKASVAWTESHGEEQVTYWDNEKYFSQTESIQLDESKNGSVTIGRGRHAFAFVVQLPSSDMPSSFKGESGKVEFHLEAQLSRSLRVPVKAKTKFTFVSRPDALLPASMPPQHGVKEKEVVFFASGKISMNIFLEKTGYQQGETLVVRGEIINSSTRKIVPKYIIYQKQSFFAQGHRAVHTTNIVKEKEAPLSSSTSLSVSKALTVPWEVTPTILNCRILKVEYRLKVILDVSFTKNPEMKLPLIILPVCDGAMVKQQPQKSNMMG
ncbi:hypothetical protein NFI96_034705 [Prochilodus magdalenae]|nr:hypothetical protein NFI96_034705 [Prochilodus magdalenae]